MRTIMIVNPHAGRQEILREIDTVWQVFEDAGMELTIELTSSPEQAAKAIRRAVKAKPARLICCGGDGTLSEAIGCVLSSGAAVPLGYIPAGTTNDFASSLGIPREPADAAQMILSGAPKDLDIGLFGDRHFIYVASFGAFTQSSYATDQGLKNALGHFAYVLEGLKELPTLKAYRVRVETEEGEVFEDDYVFGSLSNSTSFGGVVKLDPEKVDMSDGKFELTLVKMPKTLSEFNRILFSLMSGKADEELITFVHTRSATFFCEEPIAWSLDGEYAQGGASVTAKTLPRAVKIFY